MVVLPTGRFVWIFRIGTSIASKNVVAINKYIYKKNFENTHTHIQCIYMYMKGYQKQKLLY